MSSAESKPSETAASGNTVRDIYWTPWTGPGVEHLHMTDHGDRIAAFGLILRPLRDEHVRIRFGFHTDALWNTRRVMVALANAEEERPRRVVLEGDGEGHWQFMERPAPQFDGCRDVDIEASPFSNTVPIRRLNLATGQSAEIKAIYLPLPGLEPTLVRQRYTCLEPLGPLGGAFRYENLDSGFAADLQVDGDGLVKDYPETFRRSWPTW
ncbi:putative glycolipid-binding domain-containing protein [Pelagibius litoralis]|uniref:Glycolipid-binding domain-containing protein n=1 Tax=Pelagibius litoralis TaxID=374515 RepID=A0A967EY84_9PROT|nr:putative glycolipid-binding domain-containing protein [Pelagibius litoralis]NIA69610.1 putative glycolipid-binding domain-containing protein [Pelagibius litoralis]